jgi:geranylgeranyl transferase type-2 subunit alpha
MRNALWVDPADQSLWFYHQFLMTTIIEPAAYHIIVPNFSKNDRIEYVERQLTDLKDLLDGAEDCKWIYNALIDCTAVVWHMKNQQPPPEVKQDLRLWLTELKKLDPLRSGRWDYMARTLHLSN